METEYTDMVHIYQCSEDEVQEKSQEQPRAPQDPGYRLRTLSWDNPQ